MITMETRNFTQKEWNAMVSQFADLSMIQLWEYGEAKQCLQGWRAVRHIWQDGGNVVGAAQAMVKKTPFFRSGLVWINRAPLWQRRGMMKDSVVLARMVRDIRRYWIDQRGMYMRIAPTFTEGMQDDAMEAAGFVPFPNSQWISAKIDLTQSEEFLRGNLEKKWRNCLKKAEALGLSYCIGNTKEFFDELAKDYIQFLKVKNFTTSITPEFVECLHGLFPQEKGMYVLNARKGAESLGSILVISYGTSVEYLIGAVGEAGKSMNAGQYLLWNALLEMKRRGFEIFDIGGAHPQKTPPGIFHFKEGMGGKPYALIGEFEQAHGIVPQVLRMIIKYKSS